jgi:hypothetical protein
MRVIFRDDSFPADAPDTINMVALDRSLIPSDFDVHEYEDFGPATKVLPMLKRYAESDTRIIYRDDDRAYDMNWVHNLVTASGRTPDRAICDECVSINSILYRYRYPRKDLRYKT